MSKRKKISDLISYLDGLNIKIDATQDALRLRGENNLGPAMTISGGNLEFTEKKLKNLLQRKEDITNILLDESTRVKNITEDYLNHLKTKLQDNGYIIDGNYGIISFTGSNDEKKRYRDHLCRRYTAILELHENLSDVNSFTAEKSAYATVRLNKCLNNNPEWSERPFLQKLSDVLSFGLMAGFRHFFSKESKLQNNLSENLSAPQIA